MIIRSNNNLIKTVVFTGLALVAFAANSVLCRLALADGAIDAIGFTILRLVSGAICLLVIININRKKSGSSTKGSWYAGLMLFVYAITFSIAYITIDVGTGALILFGAVQITMLLHSYISGNRFYFIEWVGIVISFAGFVYLILPGVTTPSVIGFLLMAVAGIAAGLYTLKGLVSKSPLMDTAYNFLRTIPFVIILTIVTITHLNYSTEGVLLAVLSGGIASAGGYTIWYIALGGLSTIQAAVLQLLVPAIAALGGVIFASEVLTLRLTISATMILGGILMIIFGRYFLVRLSLVSKT